jgi:K+-transporting ATPase ATPase C chain
MRRQLITGAVLLGLMALLLGFVYPLGVMGFAQLGFSREANGSLVEVDGAPVASELLGQPFAGPGWFHSRPSAAGAGYDAMASSGSNLGPRSAELRTTVRQRVEQYRADNGLDAGVAVPVDAVTSSGSGLDPHISVANARLQAPRVAATRGVDLDRVLQLVDENTEHRPLGVLGETGVNVVLLNVSLDQLGGAE